MVTAAGTQARNDNLAAFEKGGSRKKDTDAVTNLVLDRELEQLENVFKRDRSGRRLLLLTVLRLRLTAVLLLLGRLAVLLLGRLTVLLLLGLAVLLLLRLAVSASATDRGRRARRRSVTRFWVANMKSQRKGQIAKRKDGVRLRGGRFARGGGAPEGGAYGD